MILKIILTATLIVDICQAGLLDGPYDNSIKDGVIFIPAGAGIFLLFTFLCKVESSPLRILSLGFWILFWIGALFGITCSAVESCTRNSRSVDLLRWLCFFSLPIWWIFMIVESRFSEERRIINNLDDARFLERHLLTLTQARPIVRWHVEFFRYVFLRDKFGRSRRQAIRIRSEDKEFNYNYWLDASEVKPEVDVRDWGITLMELHRDITPGDAETSRAMEEVQMRLMDRTRIDKLHVTVTEVRDIPGFKKQMAVFTNKGFFIGEIQFWIASVLALTWPYRWILQFLTTKVDFTIQKKVYLLQPEKDLKLKTGEVQTPNGKRLPRFNSHFESRPSEYERSQSPTLPRLQIYNPTGSTADNSSKKYHSPGYRKISESEQSGFNSCEGSKGSEGSSSKSFGLNRPIVRSWPPPDAQGDVKYYYPTGTGPVRTASNNWSLSRPIAFY